MFNPFRRAGGRFDLAVSMVGVTLGDRLLQIGCGDGGLFAALAGRVGLTGRACAVDAATADAVRARGAAQHAGVLVEVVVSPYGMLPYDPDAFDIVVVRDALAAMRPYERARCLQECFRVLRPGGRCVVMEPAPRGGLGIFVSYRGSDPSYLSGGGALGALRAEGFNPVRTLAEREGLRFTEATKHS